MGHTIYYSPVTVYRQRTPLLGMSVRVGGEYEYLGNRVKVLEINAASDLSSAEVTFETGFGERGTVDADELGRWTRKRRRPRD